MNNLILALLTAWCESYCYTADDGRAVESAIVAVAQKHLYGDVNFDGKHPCSPDELLAVMRKLETPGGQT